MGLRKMVVMDVDTLQVFIMFSSVRKCEAMELSMDFPLINHKTNNACRFLTRKYGNVITPEKYIFTQKMCQHQIHFGNKHFLIL